MAHSNTSPPSAKCLTNSQQLPHVLCGAEADYIGLLVLFLLFGYAMLMRHSKTETAIYGCHNPGDMTALGWCLSMTLDFVL